MKTAMTTLALLFALITSSFAVNRQPVIVTTDSTTYKLTVVVTDISKRTGKLYIGLSTGEANFMGELPKRMTVDVPATGEISVTFEGLAPGRYAVRLYQDLNNNQKMDFSGQMPAEPFGFSNVTTLTGPPTFDQCSFELNESKTISVSLMEL